MHLFEYALDRRPMLWIQLKHLIHERSKAIGQMVAQQLELALRDFHDHARVGRGSEGVPERQELVQDAAQRPNISGEAVRLVIQDLRTHVQGRPDERRGQTRRSGQHFGRAKVSEHHATVVEEKHILALEIAVQNLLFMQECHASSDLVEIAAVSQGR